MNVKQSAALATTVAVMLGMMGCGSDDKKSETTGTSSEAVKCQGINTCKGTSECASKDGKNSCDGHNECAGQGWITVDNAKACTDKGGKIVTG